MTPIRRRPGIYGRLPAFQLLRHSLADRWTTATRVGEISGAAGQTLILHRQTEMVWVYRNAGRLTDWLSYRFGILDSARWFISMVHRAFRVYCVLTIKQPSTGRGRFNPAMKSISKTSASKGMASLEIDLMS